MDEIETIGREEADTGSMQPADPALARWSWKDVLWVTGVCLALLAAGAAGLYLALKGSATDSTPFTWLYTVAVLLVEIVALGAGVYLAGIRRRRLSWAQIGLRLPQKRVWLIAGVLVSLVAIPLRGALVQLFEALFPPQPGLVENVNALFAPGDMTLLGGLGMLLLAGVVTPIVEELYFRGIFYRWIRQGWGVWAGVLISALVFGAMHGVPSMIVANAVMGLLLALAYEWSGSLWVPIVMHVVNNVIALSVTYLVILLNGLGA